MAIRNYRTSGLNWSTYYDSRGTIGDITNVENITYQRACFHDTYPDTLDDVEQHIKIAIKKGTSELRKFNNHYCPFSKSKIIEHIEYLKDLFDFNYNIEDRSDQYVINVDFEGKGIYFRILVTWIRYLYEFPANMALKDVYRIKDLPKFKDVNIFSLSTLVLDSLFAGYYYDDHLCDNEHPSCLVTLNELRHRIESLIEGDYSFRTMDIFKPENREKQCKIITNRNEMYTKQLEDMRIWHADGSRLGYMKDWMSKGLFKLRLKLYRENIKALKNE